MDHDLYIFFSIYIHILLDQIVVFYSDIDSVVENFVDYYTHIKKEKKRSKEK